MIAAYVHLLVRCKQRFMIWYLSSNDVLSLLYISVLIMTRISSGIQAILINVK